MAIRNNEDRTAERLAAAAEAPPQAVAAAMSDEHASPNKPLDFTCPTEFVDLPSGGKYYPEDHPLHNAESVEIRYMTAKDEDILTSKSLLKKGVAIDRFLQNVLVDKKIKLPTLLVGDKNALVVASRITGYGATYDTQVSCPACSESQNYSFDLNEGTVTQGGLEALTASMPESEGSVTATEGNTWIVDCPKSKVSVEVKLLTGADENFMVKSQSMKKKNKLPDSLLTDQLRQTIASVNGSKDGISINKFINVMPALDSRFVRTVCEKLMPNIDLTQHFECDSCGFDQEMEVPFTTDFFWPKR
jgi:hypothetical protein